MKNRFKKATVVLLMFMFLTTVYTAAVYADNTSSKVSIILKITAQDSMSGLAEMMISNYSDFKDGVWEKYAEEKEWTLLNDKGENAVYIKVKDKYNNVSEPFKTTIDLGNDDLFIGIKTNIIINNEENIHLKINLPANENIKQMRFSSDNKTYTEWENYNTEKEYDYLNAVTGNNSLYIVLKDVDNIVYTKEIVFNKPEIEKVVPKPEVPKTDETKTDEMKTETKKTDTPKINIPKTVVIAKPSTKKTVTFDKGLIVSNKADAISGKVLGERLGIPVIITGTSAVDTKNVVDYVNKNVSRKVTVYILGLGKVVPNSIEGQLKQKGYTKMVRVGGADKYETSKKIAAYFAVKKPNSILILSGEKKSLYIEDIVKVAVQKQYPIVYAKKTSLTKSTKDTILKLKPKMIYVVAAKSEVGDSVIKEIKKLTKVKVVRIDGNGDIKNIK